MDAIVELTAAEVSVQTQRVTVLATRIFVFTEAVITKVTASFKRAVLSIAGTSISAVSPDYTLIGGTA